MALSLIHSSVRQGAEIQFDSTAATPWFTYTDGSGSVHEVWFEDVRSIQAIFLNQVQLGLYAADVFKPCLLYTSRCV